MPTTWASNKLDILTEDLPPYSFLRNGVITGINIEAVKLICARAEVECNFNLLPWKRAYRDILSSKNVGLVSMARTPDREEKFAWIGPLAFSKGCFYKLKVRDDIKINTASDLLQYKVGLAKNLSYIDYLKDLGFVENHNLYLYTNKFGDLAAFSQGRIDLILGSLNTLPLQVEKGMIRLQNIVPIFPLADPRLKKGNYLALNINTDPKIVERMQTATEDFIAENAIKPIIRRFQPEPYTSILEASMPEHLKEQCL